MIFKKNPLVHAECYQPIRILAIDGDGKVALEIADLPDAIAVSGHDKLAHHLLGELGKTTIFFSKAPNGVRLNIESTSGSSKETGIAVGEKKLIAGIDWLVLQGRNGDKKPGDGSTIPAQEADDRLELLQRLCQWAANPMNGKQDVSAAFASLLDLVTTFTVARYGALALFGEQGMESLALRNISELDAEKMLLSLPDAITSDILRKGSRLILSEEVSGNFSTTETVYLRNFGKVAGFPILAEGQVRAILFLGFDNLIADLSASLQMLLGRICTIAGLVIQRAQLREQIETFKNKKFEARESQDIASRLMVGRSEHLDVLYHQIRKLAPTRVPILLSGETGTGKELAAREIHRLSNRASGPLITVNAAALPENLIESELFGHKKGAFTGALSDRRGMIEQAQGGTLFIDEIGELPIHLQAKLLRALQEKTVQRLGDDRAYSVDFRLITATHCNLQEMVRAKTFRDDLYFRIAGATINMPPLRDRPDDVQLLANFFAKQTAALHRIHEKEFSGSAIKAMSEYRWPGNIRELQNAVEKALIMSEGLMINAADLGLPGNGGIRRAGATTIANSPTIALPLNEARDQWLRSHIIGALAAHDGNKRATAETLGIGLRTLFRYIDQLQIQGVMGDGSALDQD